MRLIISYLRWSEHDGNIFTTQVVELPRMVGLTTEEQALLYLDNEVGEGVALINVWPTIVLIPDKIVESAKHWKGVTDGYDALLR